jgi:hypothetical protein
MPMVNSTSSTTFLFIRVFALLTSLPLRNSSSFLHPVECYIQVMIHHHPPRIAHRNSNLKPFPLHSILRFTFPDQNAQNRHDTLKQDTACLLVTYYITHVDATCNLSAVRCHDNPKLRNANDRSHAYRTVTTYVLDMNGKEYLVESG